MAVLVEDWFTSVGTENMTIQFNDIQVLGSNDFCIVSAIATYAIVSKTGVPKHAMENRITWGINTSGDSPIIMHEHTSAPIDFSNATAILHRDSLGPN